jgi:DNA-binding GntR family transcriptional regulator
MPSDDKARKGRKLERKTLKKEVYEVLHEDIMSAVLLPGDPIHEAAIARDLGVSRGPVREALQKLAAEGLVDITPHKGAFVSSLTWKDFLDAYQVREALETLAVHLAAARLRQEDLAQLEALHEQMKESAEVGQVSEFFSRNHEFHSLLVELAANSKLSAIYFPLAQQMRRYRMRSLTLRGGMKRSCEEHRAILDALQKGDADEAARLMSAHIQIPQQILESEHAEKELELVR